jgi:hypothetical protein
VSSHLVSGLLASPPNTKLLIGTVLRQWFRNDLRMKRGLKCWKLEWDHNRWYRCKAAVFVCRKCWSASWELLLWHRLNVKKQARNFRSYLPYFGALVMLAYATIKYGEKWTVLCCCFCIFLQGGLKPKARAMCAVGFSLSDRCDSRSHSYATLLTKPSSGAWGVGTSDESLALPGCCSMILPDPTYTS